MCINSKGSNMTIPSESPVILDDSRIPPLNLFCSIEQPLDLSCKRKRKMSEVSDRSTPSLKSARLGSTSSVDTVDGRPLSAEDPRQTSTVDSAWPLTSHMDPNTPYNFLNLLSLYRNSSYSPPLPNSNLVLSRSAMSFKPVILNNSQLPVSAASTPTIASPAATAVSMAKDTVAQSCKNEPDENQELSNSRLSSNGLRPFKAYTNGAISLASIKPPTHPDFDQGITEKLLEQSSSEEAYSDYRERWRQMQASDSIIGTQKPLQMRSAPHRIKKEPADPLSNRGNMSSSSSAAGSCSGSDSEMAYTNPRMKRHPNMTPDEQKDNLYWERRRKNNEAAKRSREARRAKEEEMTIRASFLEQENLKLRIEIASLKSETSRIKCILYNKSL